MFKIILTIGSKIKDGLGNEYILDSVIGSGGFATVYESHRLNDNEVFAVKTFSPNLNDRAQKLSFQKEIEQSNKISSENVIKYFYCHNGETFAELPPYIIMEFANQGTLADLIYNQKISGTQFDNSVIIDFFKQLSNGMLEVSKYFVHRDIKPENILIKDDKLKISDFGLSKIVTERTQSLTMKGYGTALYSPPEAWLGKENTLQMDIYSMGIVFYNIATLNYPYNITNLKDDNEIKQAHLYNGVKNPRIYNPDLPEELAAIIIKMLEKSLNDRFKNWDEILKHINKSNSNDNGINKFVSKALEKRNVKDLEIANKKAEESKTRHEKLMHGEMIYSQYKNKLVPLITDFINNFNQAYPRTKKYILTKIEPHYFSNPFKFTLKTPSDDIIEIITQVIFKDDFEKETNNPFDPDKPFRKNYIPQCNNKNILAWSQIRDSSKRGFNIILLNTENSPYGKWYMLINKNNGLSSSTRPEPFGFSLEELPEEINHINCIHIYDSELEEFDSDKFLNFLSDHV